MLQPLKILDHSRSLELYTKYTGSNYKTENAGDENCQWTTMDHADWYLRRHIVETIQSGTVFPRPVQ